MVRKATLALGLAGGFAAASGLWTLYQRNSTDTIPYTVVATVDDVELRRYPRLVVAETEAPSENVAFRRLFRYIDGANEGDADISMTAPVEVSSGGGVSISMTAPVEVSVGGRTPPTAATESEPVDDADVRMRFHLPETFDIDTAPAPTDDSVTLEATPERTLAVRQFSGQPTDGRVDRERERLTETLADASVPTVGDPFFMGYDAPWTLPFLRRNEVAVEVASVGQE